MKILLCSLLAWGLAGVCPAQDWPVRSQQVIQKTLPFSGATMRLIVNNVQGYVHVKGVSGSEVRMTAHETIRAETDSDLAQARSEVKLDVKEQPGSVSISYDSPSRHGDHRHSYSVTYDIDVEVPASGNFEVSDVNGGIEMTGIAGAGSVHTVNGPVSVHFAQNPARPCSFKSINGSMDVWFQLGFSADLMFKTLNGQVYSDFDVAPRAISAAAVTENHDGKFVYRSNGISAGRAGNGGPELTFDTLNGSVRLHKEQ